MIPLLYQLSYTATAAKDSPPECVRPPQPPAADGRSAFSSVVDKGILPVLRAWRHLLLPPVCICCRWRPVDGDPLCRDCRADLPAPLPPCGRCLRHEQQPAVGCPTCTCAPPAALSRLALHQGTLRKLLLDAKWRHRDDLIPPLAIALAERIAIDLAPPPETLVVPVPRSWKRRWIHGTALSERLAPVVAKHLGGESLALLGQIHSRAQAGQSGRARRSLPAGSFVVSARALRSSRKRAVILLDDVLTTGATLRTAGRALLAKGVSLLAVAVLTVSDGSST